MFDSTGTAQEQDNYIMDTYPKNQTDGINPFLIADSYNSDNSNATTKNIPHTVQIEPILDSHPSENLLDSTPPTDYEYLNQTPIKPIFDNVTNIHAQYLGDSIAISLQNNKNIIVNSGMKTGKTTAIKEILKNLSPDECACIQAPRTKLLRSMAAELGFYFYEDLKKEKDKDTRKMMARRLCVTPQSAPALFAEFPEIKYKLLVIDESETQAGMMVSSATKDKEKALDALKEVAKQADHIALMDAHASEKTESLMNIMADGETVHTLINTYKPWDNIDADILEGGNYKKRRSAIDALQIEAIKENKKIAICSSSKKYCQERKTAISRLFPALQVLLITADDSQHTQDLLNNTDMLIAWDVVIFSPAVSVGVSFDLSNHINQVFGVFPNTQHTGDTDDAIQALARIRKPVDCKWTICLDEDKNIFKGGVNCPDEVVRALMERRYRTLNGLGDKEGANETELQLIDLYAVCDYERTHSKNNFNKLFRQRLRDMGVTINTLPYDEIAENQASNEATDDVKAEAVERDFIARTESPRITEEEAQEIRVKQKYKPWELLDGETDSLKRFQAEKNLMINFDDYSEGEKREYIELLDDGAISKCINREIALAPKEFTKEYMQARKYGLGEKGAFKRDILDDSFNYPLLKKILNYAVPYFDGREYTHNDLKRGALVKFIGRNQKEINALRIIALPDKWKLKPALLVNHLLGMCGYSHTSHQVGNGKKQYYIFRAVNIAPIDRLVEKRKDQGSNWTDSTRALMEIYRDNQTIDSAVFGGASLDADINELADSDFINEDVIGYKLDAESKNHFYEKLAKVPENDQKKVIDNYILIATSPASESSRFTPQALANLSMIKEARKYELRE